MIRVSVMYPNSDGATFDFDYYCQRHMPMVRQLLGDIVKGISVDKGINAPNAPATYMAIGHILCDSVEGFESAFVQHGPALMADIPNYTSIRPVVQLSEVRL